MMDLQEYFKLRKEIDSYIRENFEPYDGEWTKKPKVERLEEPSIIPYGMLIKDDISRSMCMEKPILCGFESDISELDNIKLGEKEKSFSSSLLEIIDEKKLKDSKVYKTANVTKQVFSKIRIDDGYRPTKATAIKLCLALELSLEQSLELLQKASLYISKSNTIDLSIRYFFQNKIYNIDKINMYLYNTFGGTIDELKF